MTTVDHTFTNRNVDRFESRLKLSNRVVVVVFGYVFQQANYCEKQYNLFQMIRQTGSCALRWSNWRFIIHLLPRIKHIRTGGIDN